MNEENMTRAQTLEALRRDVKAALGEDAAHNARVAKHLGELMERAFDRLEKLEAAHYEGNRILLGVRERVKELREFKADVTEELGRLKINDSNLARALENGRPLSPHTETNIQEAIRLLEHDPPYVDQARAELDAALRRVRGEIG